MPDAVNRAATPYSVACGSKYHAKTWLDDHGGHRINLQRGRRARSFGVGAIAEGRPGPGQELPRADLRLAPPAHPLGDEGALVLGHRAADLQEELVMRALTHRTVDEQHLRTQPREFL